MLRLEKLKNPLVNIVSSESEWRYRYDTEAKSISESDIKNRRPIIFYWDIHQNNLDLSYINHNLSLLYFGRKGDFVVETYNGYRTAGQYRAIVPAPKKKFLAFLNGASQLHYAKFSNNPNNVYIYSDYVMVE